MDHVVALDALPAPALACDAGGRLTAVNARCAALFATDEPALLQARLATLFPREGEVALRLARTGSRPLRVHGRRFTGVPFTAEARASIAVDGSLLVLLHEVEGERLLSESQHRLDLAFEYMPTGMALFNTDGEYVRVNAALCRLLDRSPATLLGRRDQEFTHPDDRQSDVDAAWRILSGELHTWQTEKRFLRPDGSVVWALANLTFLRDRDGRPLCWVGQFQDITGRKRREHRLRHMAEHDDLTGVANRRRLVAELELRLEHAARHGEQGALLVLDLDGFKAINDTQGHDAGDQVLVTAAVALRRRLRVTDVLGRLGGDEFAVILPHLDADGALRVSEQLLEEVRAATHGTVTASCGIALYGPDRPGAPDALLSAADRAMYVAKARGRDAAVLDGVA
jgi:diguanylate cyclase (GGDEF)-like protein/PAS domain S-box-containing protein